MSKKMIIRKENKQQQITITFTNSKITHYLNIWNINIYTKQDRLLQNVKYKETYTTETSREKDNWTKCPIKASIGYDELITNISNNVSKFGIR